MEKLAFARLVAWICARSREPLLHPDLMDLDEMTRPTSANATRAVDDVLTLMGQGRTIEAIKRYREITGAGLKEAKDLIEAAYAGRQRA